MLFLKLMQADADTLQVLRQRPHGIAFYGQDLQHTGLGESTDCPCSDYLSLHKNKNTTTSRQPQLATVLPFMQPYRSVQEPARRLSPATTLLPANSTAAS